MNLAAYQQALGHEVSQLSWGRAVSPSEIRQLLSGGECGEIAGVWPLRSNLRGALRTIRSFDILHIHAGFFGFEAAFVSLLARLARVPYVYSPHGALGYRRFTRGSWKQRVFYHTLGSSLLNHARWIQVASANEKALLRAYQVRAPVVLIPNGISPRRLIAAEEVLRNSSAARHRTPNAIIVGFLGRLDIFTKGLDILLTAASEVRRQDRIRMRLLIAGPDWYGERRKLEDMAKRLQIASEVAFTGPVPYRDVLTFMIGLDVLAIPSRSENSPLVFLEAGAASRPSIVSTGSNVGHIVDQWQSGLIADGPHVLAQAMTSVALDPESWEQRGKNARTMAEAHTWPDVAKQVCLAYEKMLQG